MEKLIRFSSAFDRRDPDPDKNYGIHGMELRFVLKGSKGAVQFLIYTHWYLPHVSKELVRKCFSPREIELFFIPMGVDIGYHSPEPIYDGQMVMKDCDYTGGDCYYDGSGLWAEEFMPTFLAKGDDAVWKMLTKYYNETFGKE